MGRDLTKRYVDEVLEVSGVKKKGIERIREISQMPDREVRRLLDDLADRGTNHYSKNLRSILEDLQALKGQPKAYYFGWGYSIQFEITTPDRFIRRSALYYNKIVLEDPLEYIVAYGQGWEPSAVRRDLADRLARLSFLWPWIKEGIVELIPPPIRIAGLAEKIDEYSEEDFQDAEDWRPQALKLVDLREAESFLSRSSTPDYIAKAGGLKKLTLMTIARGSSIAMGRGFLGSSLTSASPTTDLRHGWKLFGVWISRRAKNAISQELGADRWESFAREVKAGRAWLALEARELGVLDKLPRNKIIEIRDSADYSLRYFREELGDAVEEIQGLKLDDEAAYREAANQAWSKVRDSARDVKKNMDTIKNTIRLDAGVLAMSLVLGLLPFDTAKLATALIGAPTALDIAKEYLELRELKKSTGYFLVKLEESSSHR